MWEGATYAVVADHDHYHRRGGHAVHGVQIAQRIHRHHLPVSSLAGTQAAGAVVVAGGLHLGHPRRAPRPHELVLLLAAGDVGAGAVLARAGGGGGSSSSRRRGAFGFLAEAEAVGEVVERLAEGAFAGPIEGFGVGDDAFGAGVGVEQRGAGDVVDGGGHGRLGGEAGLFFVVVVVVVAGRGRGDFDVRARVGVVAGRVSVVGVRGRVGAIGASREGVELVLRGGGHGNNQGRVDRLPAIALLSLFFSRSAIRR